MSSKIKRALSNQMPVTNKNFNAEMERITQALGTIEKAYLKIEQELSTLQEHVEKIEREQSRFDAWAGKSLERVERTGKERRRVQDEIVWAEVFNNTITDSTWLKNKTFSPGRWALGYQALYVLYRVLNEIHPTSILELGLGQSTSMITQYAAQNPKAKHIVVEHDANWIDFYRRGNLLSDNTRILPLGLEMVPYKEAESVRAYAGFQSSLQGKKFDLILIDAPIGGDMKQYARIDVLSILPDGLRSSFVILMDDTNRVGENHTVAEISDALKGLNAQKHVYSGAKDICMWVSPDLNFLCSM